MIMPVRITALRPSSVSGARMSPPSWRTNALDEVILLRNVEQDRVGDGVLLVQQAVDADAIIADNSRYRGDDQGDPRRAWRGLQGRRRRLLPGRAPGLQCIRACASLSTK
jgi:hypothetical protein